MDIAQDIEPRQVTQPLRVALRYMTDIMTKYRLKYLMRVVPILLVAVLIHIPAMLHPAGGTDSAVYNYIWTAGFSDALRHGVYYQRWFPASFDGLGSPTFYFYPPLAFWTSGAIASIGVLPLTAVVLAATVFSAASGLAMYVWLARQTRHALAGAIVYMVAPYHLYDFYVRGALAEYAAFIWPPLIMLSMSRLPDRRWILPLALSYACLLITHLPLAVLTTAFLIIPTGVYLACRNRKILVPGLAAGLLGIALASFYLFPALVLQKSISTDLLWSDYYRPSTWFPWNKTQFDYITGIPILAVVLIVCGAATRNFWGIMTCFAGCAALGLIPFVWNIPVLAEVQFPWRLVGLVEFCAITALCIGARRDHLLKFAMALAIVPASNFATKAVVILGSTLDVRRIEAVRPDAPEYLPPALPKTGITDVRRTPNLSAYQHLARGDRIHVSAKGRVVIGHADFPIWQVVHNGKIIPHTGPLINFDASEPGEYLVQRTRVPSEALGWMTSFVAAFAALMLFCWNWSLKRAQSDTQCPPKL